MKTRPIISHTDIYKHFFSRTIVIYCENFWAWKSILNKQKKRRKDEFSVYMNSEHVKRNIDNKQWFVVLNYVFHCSLTFFIMVWKARKISHVLASLRLDHVLSFFNFAFMKIKCIAGKNQLAFRCLNSICKLISCLNWSHAWIRRVTILYIYIYYGVHFNQTLSIYMKKSCYIIIFSQYQKLWVEIMLNRNGTEISAKNRCPT